MPESGSFTYQEIMSQPEAWAQALEIVRSQEQQIQELWHQFPDMEVVFTGCGSTYYLSLAAAALFQMLTGRGARAFPAGELYLYPKVAFGEGNQDPILLVAVSRSGTTSETIAAVNQFAEENRGPVMSISTYGDTPLANLCDLSIVIPAGGEQSVAQTRSFASMYVASVALATLIAGRLDLFDAMSRLPSLGERLLEKSGPQARAIGENLALDRFYFLGSGPRYGLACEANLKMKEMTLTHSEPFHFLEFRHGPMSMVKDTAMVIGLRSEINRRHEQAVLKQMRAFGGQVFELAETGGDLNFQSQIPESVRNVLYLPPLQLMAYYRSLKKGLNPDRPQNLTAVVELDLN
jgi:glucosamine--fructose-6-phosphate aminotransferase (isomerizing)